MIVVAAVLFGVIFFSMERVERPSDIKKLRPWAWKDDLIFTEFLKVSGLFDPWVEECPVRWRSNNAPNKRDVLGTMVLSILCGHWRYAHMSALRGDQVNAELLGMEKVVSEDSVRGTLAKMGEPATTAWLEKHIEQIEVFYLPA